MRNSVKSSKNIFWKPEERSGLNREIRSGGDPLPIEKFISVPFDANEPQFGRFDLYYYANPSYAPGSGKSVIFCAGGPGEIVKPRDNLEPTYADFLRNNGYNVLHFHLRGCGYSQFPASAEFDKFIRTRFAVEDMDAIRRDFIGENEKWAAVIGRSFGTVLAQQYASRFSERLDRLILISPLSRHMFKASNGPSNDALENYLKNVRAIQRESLKNIFNLEEETFRDEFADLSNDEENQIIDAVFGDRNDQTKPGIYTKAEEAFGNIQFIVDAYDDLKREGLLKKYELDNFSRNFFVRLRDLRMVGSISSDELSDRQLAIGKTIREEVLAVNAGLPTDSATKRSSIDLAKHEQNSYRVFYTMAVFDGLDPRMLSARLAAGHNRDTQRAIKAIGGDASVNAKRPVNKALDKIRNFEKAAIKPWDPADCSHSIPTLILKGGADPVTAAGQAEYIFDKALVGQRTLIEIPRAGHDIVLPEVEDDDRQPILSGAMTVTSCRIRAGETVAVKATVRGRNLDEDLHVELKPRSKLQSGLRCLGYGVPVEENKNKIVGAGEYDDTLVLIENVGNQKSRKKDAFWTFDRSYYSGMIKLPMPAIPPNSRQLVSGQIQFGIKNAAKEPKLRPDRALEKGLELFGYSIKRGDSLVIWLVNKGKEQIDGKTRTWTVSINNRTIGKFKFDSPLVRPGKVVASKPIVVDGLGRYARGEMLLSAETDSKTLEACVPSRPTEFKDQDTFRLGIVNTGSKTIPARSAAIWSADNVSFTAKLKVKHDPIPPGGGVQGQARFTEQTWKPWVNIRPPACCESGLTLVGFNILGPTEILLLIQNNTQIDIELPPKDWIYFDPNDDKDAEDQKQSACLNCGDALKCLMYSFLILDPMQFVDDNDNKVLRIFQDIFRQNSEAICIKFAAGDRRGN